MTTESAAGPSAGEVVGARYKLVRVIGSGGMGTVWEATSLWTERRVALKFLSAASGRDGPSTVSPDQAERFLREAKATARVKHPNVVDVLDMGNDVDHGGLFIAYELLEGETLRGLLGRRHRLTLEEATAVLVPAMEGVAAAHRNGVVHRDLKPENIFLARDASGDTVPRVIDFGIAKFDVPDDALTRAGVTLGTARYMSPEQCRGDSDIDARADVWALGVLWFEALTGRVPFEGAGYNQVLAAVLTSDAPPIRSVSPEVPPATANAIDRALQRERAARIPSVEAFLTALTARADSVAVPAVRRRVVVALAFGLVTATTTAAVVALRNAPTVQVRVAPVRSAPSDAVLAAPPREAPVVALVVDASVASDAAITSRPPDASVARRALVRLASPSQTRTIRPVEPDPNGAPVLEP